MTNEPRERMASMRLGEPVRSQVADSREPDGGPMVLALLFVFMVFALGGICGWASHVALTKAGL